MCLVKMMWNTEDAAIHSPLVIMWKTRDCRILLLCQYESQKEEYQTFHLRKELQIVAWWTTWFFKSLITSVDTCMALMLLSVQNRIVKTQLMPYNQLV